MVVNGAERTTAYPIVEEAARRFDLTITPDPRPEAGSYYRSDHFSFARVGIPSFSIEEGRDLLGKPPGTGEKLFADFNDHHYHQPSDEYSDDWDFSGMEQLRALRDADRRQCRQRAQAAHLARRRRVSSGSGEGGSEVEAGQRGRRLDAWIPSGIKRQITAGRDRGACAQRWKQRMFCRLERSKRVKERHAGNGTTT